MIRSNSIESPIRLWSGIMRMRSWILPLAFSLLSLCLGSVRAEQSAPTLGATEKIIIDTDIGGDIDDAFAIALALRSPHLEILGFSTESGDTEGRAKILDRLLGEVGRSDIPVTAGAPTSFEPGDELFAMSQVRYGANSHFAHATHPQAVDFILEKIRRYPGEITLVIIGPPKNIGTLIDQSPETFHKLKRVVVMGGWIEPTKEDYENAPAQNPEAEWNIREAIGAVQKMFTSGVPLYVMPVDSVGHLQLSDVNRDAVFAHGTPLTDALTLLYHQWSHVYRMDTPGLYDAMTIAYILDPTLCPVQPMHIRVDDQGFTRAEPGKPNVQVCLHSDADAFFRFYMKRLLAQ